MLDAIQEQLAPIYDVIDSTWDGNIYMTESGRKYERVSESQTSLPQYPYDKSKLISVLKISDYITAAAASCFIFCTNLTAIDMASSNIKSIGQKAFSRTGLLSCVLPPGVQSIGKEIFSYCPSLKYVRASDSMTPSGLFGGSNAYRRCTSLELIDGRHNPSILAEQCKEAVLRNPGAFLEVNKTFIIGCYDSDLSCKVTSSGIEFLE